MKILVTGGSGQLGYDVVQVLLERNLVATGVGSKDFDLTDATAVAQYIINYKPDAVIHCAAFTAVDKAEEERDTAYAVNVEGTAAVAGACRELDIPMLYISTDYVFSGEGNVPFEANSPKSPSNYYGLTKSLGEDKVREILSRYFIVRVSWVFGVNGNNFVRTMLRLGREREQIQVVNDQIGSPTYTADLARLIADMIITDKYGVYHATNEGFCSWFDFAAEIMKAASLDCEIIPVSSEKYAAKAKRPKNSRLAKESLDSAGWERLPSWQNALYRYIRLLQEQRLI